MHRGLITSACPDPPDTDTHTPQRIWTTYSVYTAADYLTIMCSDTTCTLFMVFKSAWCRTDKTFARLCLLKFRFGSAVYWKQNEICLALRHLPGLSPWAWGRPSATQWPPWQCLPAAAWLREGDGWCGSHCLTPLSLLLEVAHPNLEDKSEKEERIGEGGMEGKWQKMGHVRNSER